MYTIEQVLEVLANHEAVEGYDGIEECVCGVTIGAGMWISQWTGETHGNVRYDEHLKEAVRKDLTGA